MGAQDIVERVLSLRLRIWECWRTTDENIEYDLGLLVAGRFALVDGAVGIDIDDGATIHEGAHAPDRELGVRIGAWRGQPLCAVNQQPWHRTHAHGCPLDGRGSHTNKQHQWGKLAAQAL